MAKLEQLITQAALKKLAGAAAFERGKDYFAEGAVNGLRYGDEKVGAQVLGYGTFTSYQYPAGLDLARIAPPPPK